MSFGEVDVRSLHMLKSSFNPLEYAETAEDKDCASQGGRCVPNWDGEREAEANKTIADVVMFQMQ